MKGMGRVGWVVNVRAGPKVMGRKLGQRRWKGGGR